MNKLIKNIKENEQDFEFYPTTDEIIKCMSENMPYETNMTEIKRFLDIGAGNGKVLDAIKNNASLSFKKFYAIEKSMILVDQMDKDIIILGTDFMKQTLIDKEADVIFSNPPYSEFKTWMKKIIKESDAKYIFLVVPERWSKDKEINELIKTKNMTAKVLGDFSFENAEDRKARSKVNLIRLSSAGQSYYRGDNAFSCWFDENFKINSKSGSDISDYDREISYKKKISDQLVPGFSLVSRLEELYNQELQRIHKNYQMLCELDEEIFHELEISVKNIKEKLKMKISGLKKAYWKELFNGLKELTDRLTVRSRENLLKKMTDNVSVDFSSDNALSIIIWAVKNANFYYEKQLIDCYESLTKKENIINYKSNKRILEENWRYYDSNFSHYSLDYRLIHESWEPFNGNSYDMTEGLKKNTHNFINDVLTIANNLGFKSTTNSHQIGDWAPGKKKHFMMVDGKELVEIKCYKKGTLHFKFNQDFMKTLNVEYGKIKRWLKKPSDVEKEMGLKKEESVKYFNANNNIKINYSNIKLLT